MSWDVSVAGTVHLDDITTPHGHRPRLHGGSAVYFSLAAVRRAHVNFYGIVGQDAVAEFRDLLKGLPINLDGLSESETRTFHWHARHDYDAWVAREDPSEPGCDAEWHPQLDARGTAAPILFLGSMSPHVQLRLAKQSSARLIGVDSMTNWIGPDRGAVEAVAAASDLLFLNRTELAALVPEVSGDWRAAATALLGRGRLRGVIVKAGPDGAAIVSRSGIVEKPAAAIALVMDPTGAGDALAGGFLGMCAEAERDDDEFFATALDEGLRSAASAISQFGTAGLRAVAPAQPESRVK